MKKNVLLLAGIAVMLTACEKNQVADGLNMTAASADGQKAITFRCEGDFGNETFSRAALEADGKAMTDLWVLDYVGGTLVQQVHQEQAPHIQVMHNLLTLTKARVQVQLFWTNS